MPVCVKGVIHAVLSECSASSSDNLAHFSLCKVLKQPRNGHALAVLTNKAPAHEFTGSVRCW